MVWDFPGGSALVKIAESDTTKHTHRTISSLPETRRQEYSHPGKGLGSNWTKQVFKPKQALGT